MHLNKLATVAPIVKCTYLLHARFVHKVTSCSGNSMQNSSLEARGELAVRCNGREEKFVVI